MPSLCATGSSGRQWQLAAKRLLQPTRGVEAPLAGRTDSRNATGGAIWLAIKDEARNSARVGCEMPADQTVMWCQVASKAFRETPRVIGSAVLLHSPRFSPRQQDAWPSPVWRLHRDIWTATSTTVGGIAQTRAGLFRLALHPSVSPVTPTHSCPRHTTSPSRSWPGRHSSPRSSRSAHAELQSCFGHDGQHRRMPT